MKPKIYYVKRLPMKWAIGMAVPPFGLFIKKGHEDNEKIHRHEMVHWEQYISRGVLKFYFGYFYWWIKSGFSYKNHPWEIEARENS
jgi:hypothetical protein